MSKTRLVPLVMATAFALTMSSIALAQGPGGRGGAGGGGGARGGFGGGGSLIGLAQMPPVQEELKVTDAQKPKLKELSDAVNKKRGEIFAAMRANGGGAGGNAGGGGGNASGAGGGNGAQAQNGGRAGRGGQGGFANMTDEQREAFQVQMTAMRTATDKLTKDGEAQLNKILDSKQRTRLAQIALQRQGLNAFRTPELIAKLNINEDTQTQINAVLDDQGQARRAQFTKMRDAMAKLVGGNGANGGQADRQAMRDAMQLPENQAKMTEQRKSMDEETKAMETRAKAQIARLLTKRQRDAYAKLYGAPFDLTTLNNRGGRGGPGGNAPATAGVETPGASTPKPAATAPARDSLRSRRGNSSDSK